MINHFPLEGSGSGVYTKNLAKELTTRGHKVKVVFPENTKVPSEEFEIRPIFFDGAKKIDYEIDYNFPCFTSHPRSNNTFYRLDDGQIRKYIDTFIKAIKEEVEKFKPDIIHAQHLWIAPYAAAKTDIPYVITAHGTDIKGFKKDSRYHPYAIEGARKAKKVITISRQVDEDVKELYKVEENRRKIIMNGYDEELFIPKNVDKMKVLKEFNINVVPDYIVSFAGKLTHFKGVDVLIKAAKMYSDALNKNVVTLIAGNGELYNELRRLKESLNLSKVFFLGHVSQQTLVDIYNISDVNVVPSRMEPFGLVAVEALACGTPVVGTNQGGLVDFINDEVGSLVDVDDDIELYKAIIKELTRKDKEERSKKAHRYAAENFSWKRTVDKVEKLYKEIINSYRLEA
jgi:glycosyltransferase involved in cell wall biosynthesis